MRRMRRTLAEKARARYTGYLVKEPMELMDPPAVKMPGVSRTKLKSLLSKRIVLAGNAITTQLSSPLQPDVKVLISKDENKKGFRHPLLKVVYENAYIVVVKKKEGLFPVGTDRQKERAAQYILSEYVGRSRCRDRILVVHRLGRDTSGLMTLAKDEKTRRTLRDHWRDIVMGRRYVAVVTGGMGKDSDTVVSWLTDRTLHAGSSSYDGDGSKSITYCRIIKHVNRHSLVELRLETGRKSQIRVHMQDLGRPLIGDGRYGIDGGPSPLGRLALYAFKLRFYYPVADQLMEFKTPYPPTFKKLLFRR